MRSFSDIESALLTGGWEAVAGVDEAGRGPLAGPVVAAAVVFPAGAVIEGIEDSKKLTHRKRLMLAEEIIRVAVSHGVGIVSPERIDEVNILRASIEAMHQAIDALQPAPQYLLVDGNRFFHATLPFRTVVKGDARCFSIAAASILAKVTRDGLMTALDSRYPQYGFSRHKGYPTRQHIEALRRFGPTEIHRKSFVVRELGGQTPVIHQHS